MVALHLLPTFVVALAVLTQAAPVTQGSTPTSSRGQGAQPVMSTAEAPEGSSTPEVQWVKVSAPDLGVMLAAVARPQGTGPFPAILLLHGTHGFAQQYVDLARIMARNGLVGVAACWFAGGSGPGARFVTPIGCPEAPPMRAASDPMALQAVDALVQAVRTLPGVRPDRVALFGHSRGGGATLHYVFGEPSVRAAVLNSAGYPRELSDRVPEVKVPILMLHGTADSSADGGSMITNVQMARDFETALRSAGKQVEATYYDGAGHNGIFTSLTQRDAEVQRIVAFLKRHLFN